MREMEREAEVVSVGNWMLTIIVLAIPLVNLVMFLYWAFSPSTLPSKQNFVRANLIFFAFGIAFAFIVPLVSPGLWRV